MHFLTLLALGLYSTTVVARGGHDGHDDDDDDDDDPTSTTSAASSTSTGNSTGTLRGFSGDLTGLTGDSVCNSVSPRLLFPSMNLLNSDTASFLLEFIADVHLCRA